MAVAIRGTPTTTSGNGATATLNVPTGVQEGDLLVTFIGGASVFPEDTQTGWRALTQYIQGSVNMRCHLRRASGSEPSDYGFTLNTSGQYAGVMVAFSGAASLIASSSSTASSSSSTTLTAGGVTPRTANGVLLAAFAQVSPGTFTAPSGYSEQANALNSGNVRIAAYTDDNAAKTATGNVTATSGATQHGGGLLLHIGESPAVFDAGFETNDTSEFETTNTSGTGMSAAVSTDADHAGTYGYRVEFNNNSSDVSADGSVREVYRDAGNGVSYLEWWFRFPTFTSLGYASGQSKALMGVRPEPASASSHCLSLNIVGTRQVQAHYVGGDNSRTTFGSAFTFDANTWYRIRVMLDRSGANPVVQWWTSTDGTTFTDRGSATDSSSGTSGVKTVNERWLASFGIVHCGQFEKGIYTVDIDEVEIKSDTAALGGADPVTGTVALTLPALTEASSGAETMTGTSAITLPAITTESAGTAGDPPEPVTGTVALTLPTLTETASGVETIAGTVAMTLPTLSEAAAGWAAAVGTVAITLPAADLTAWEAEPTASGRQRGRLRLPGPWRLGL